MQILSLSPHDTTLDVGTHQANTSPKALDNMQVQLIFSHAFVNQNSQVIILENFGGKMPLRIS